MSHLPNLELLDADGAIRDSAEAAGLDRSDFLKKGVLAGGGLLAGSALFTQYVGTAEAAISNTRRSAGNDVKILNFALTLEFLESAFYRQADINKVYGDNAALQRFTSIGNRTTGSPTRTFTRAGTYRYECTLHPGMTGRISVR